jgi:DNA polymerase/3'-5' exonuclease PolX
MLAKKKGWHLAASGDGLFNEKGQRVAGGSEESIYEALELPYQEPWERN